MEKCVYCEKICKNKNSLAQHKVRCKFNNNRKIPFPLWKSRIDKPSWNKGLTKITDDRVKAIGITYSKKCKAGECTPSFKNKHHSQKTRDVISKKLSLNNKGGRCKWFITENNSGVKFSVQGTWELKFTKYLNTIDDNWVKIGIGNKIHSFEWVDDNGKNHWYTPDFWSDKLKKYFEIKGYWWGKDREKMEKVITQNNINLEIVNKEKLEFYLKYV